MRLYTGSSLRSESTRGRKQKKNLTAYRTKMKRHCREGSEKKEEEEENKAISLGNSDQEVIGYVVSRLVTGL